MQLISLIPLAIVVVLQNPVFCQGGPDNYRAEFLSKKFLEHDSTQKVNFTVEGSAKSTGEQKALAEAFQHAFFASLNYTYDVVTSTIDKDSSTISWCNFKSRSSYLKIDFSTQEYIYSWNALAKKSGNRYIDVREISPEKKFNLWRDSVIYTQETVLVNEYTCLVAFSAFDPGKKYYICKELPSNINPGVLVINAVGAVLGIMSDNYTSVLKKLDRIASQKAGKRS